MGEKGIEKFKGEGFHTWQTKLRGYLMKKNLWGIIKAPSNTSESISTRASTAINSAQDEQALGIIITSLDDNYIHFIDECQHAYDAWDILERNFGAKTKRSKIALKCQLNKLTKEPEEDIASLINRLKSITTQLTYIECTVPEDDKVVALLNALPESYNNIVTILEEKEPAPSLTDAISSLQNEEKKLGLSPSKGGGAYFVKSSTTCSTCNKPGHLSKDCYQNNPCHYCKRTGHPPERCYYKDNDKKTSNNKKTSSSSSSNNNNSRRPKGRVNLTGEGNDAEDDQVNTCNSSHEDYSDIL